MSTTTDPNDPDLGRGADAGPVPQNKKYLVLSPEELAKGFVRPLRFSYVHVGPLGPAAPVRDLTPEEHTEYERYGYVKWEEYGEDHPNKVRGSSLVGRYWTQAQLDAVGKGCNTVTKMDPIISATYARDPGFYGATYCIACRRHLPVGEFVWEGTEERVGS